MIYIIFFLFNDNSIFKFVKNEKINREWWTIYSSKLGDLRKEKSKISKDDYKVDESALKRLIRRLTSGKGRTVIEIKGLPANKNWWKGLAKDLKKKIGVGDSFKNDFIEIHGENFEQVAKFLNTKKISFKKIGG